MPETDIEDCIPPADGVVHGVCPHDCPDCCSLLSQVEAGRLIKVSGNPEHPVTRGFICRKFAASPTRVYARDRVRHPMKRIGHKGEGRFQQISWDEAMEIISRRWKGILQQAGPHAILPFYGSGTEGLVNGHLAGKRFFNRLGSLQLDRTICTKSGRTGYRYTMGTSMGADPSAIAGNRLIVAWGTNAASTNIHQQAFLRDARGKGARYAVVNPVKVRGTAGADFFLQPRPGSDAALALGMMHVIIAEDLYDRDFVNRYTSGFAQLKKHVEEYSPTFVATLTDIAADEIRNFARVYAELKPSFIYVGPGCQRHSNGGMTVRTIACLPALVGAWQNEGSGLYFPTSTIFPVDLTPLEGMGLRPNPPAKYNMIDLGRKLADSTPRIESLYVFNGNPASVMFNQNRLREQLRRDDLFTVVHELAMTDTARYADILLPATSQFEQLDLSFSYYHFGVLLNRPAIAPLDECRSNLDTFRHLAEAMGFTDPCFTQSHGDIVREILDLDHPALAGVTLEHLLARGWSRAKLEPAHALIRNGRLPSASGRIEFFSKDMEQDGFNPLPSYSPPLESREHTPELYRDHPLFFITASAQSALNSNHAAAANRANGKARPTLLINPEDAKGRNIGDGELVDVFNRRGRCRLHATISTDVKTGVVASTGLWWDEQYAGGCNSNHTTPDFTGDIGAGSAFNSNLVQVEAAALSGLTADEPS